MTRPPPALGIVGRSGSGKTTLIERLLPLLRARGLRVSTIKHTHHDVDLDPPGKDSHRHRQAGAGEVLLASDHRWALLVETPDRPEPLSALLSRLGPADLVLVEGFATAPDAALLARLEVVRADHRSRPRRAPLFEARDAAIDLVAADTATVPGWSGPVLPLDVPEAIRDWLLRLLPRWQERHDF